MCLEWIVGGGVVRVGRKAAIEKIEEWGEDGVAGVAALIPSRKGLSHLSILLHCYSQVPRLFLSAIVKAIIVLCSIDAL